MSTVTAGHHTALSERPERSRNAKAQARHRAKRKAYIEQLEQTVTKLQTALGFTPEQVAALPPPLLKIRELEQENARLQRENEEMRRMLADPGTRALPMDNGRRSSIGYSDSRAACVDRDYLKRRKMVSVDDVYMASGEHATPHHHDIRPPPLTIPPQTSIPHNAYSSMPSSAHSAHTETGSGSLFNLQGSAFQLPNTPSGSSSTSSPPFSPNQMQAPISHSPLQHRGSVQTHGYYGSVKMEDEHYVHAPNHSHHSNYSLPPSAPAGQDMDSWYTYERAPLHR